MTAAGFEVVGLKGAPSTAYRDRCAPLDRLAFVPGRELASILLLHARKT
ncbi:hypothetical protein ACRAWF_25205 [Streptomyces sp. L7]